MGRSSRLQSSLRHKLNFITISRLIDSDDDDRVMCKTSKTHQRSSVKLSMRVAEASLNGLGTLQSHSFQMSN